MSHRSAPLNILSILDAKVITGPARGLLHLARHLPDTMHLHVALLRPRGTGPLPPLAEQARSGRLTVWALEENSPFDARLLLRARELARQIHADIVQTHSYKPHLIGAALRVAYGAPWIAFHHGWTAENLKVRLYHALDRLTLPRADRVVAVSRSSECLVLSIGCRRERTLMITNAVDAADLDPGCTRDEARTLLGLPAEGLIVCSIGRLSHEKGQDLLIRAFAAMAWEFPGMTLVLAGDGPERMRLEALVREQHLEGRVRFLGHQPEVARVYAASDIVVLPSRSEGMPNALLEAMCAGVAVIATKVGGVSEVATDGETAWLVAPEDVSAMARALAHAARDGNERARRAARARALVVETMSPERRAARFVELYESVLAPGPSSEQAVRTFAEPASERSDPSRPPRVIIAGSGR